MLLDCLRQCFRKVTPVAASKIRPYLQRRDERPQREPTARLTPPYDMTAPVYLSA